MITCETFEALDLFSDRLWGNVEPLSDSPKVQPQSGPKIGHSKIQRSIMNPDYKQTKNMKQI